MANTKDLAVQLKEHIVKTSAEHWPGASILSVVDASGQMTDGYVWCDLAGTTVRCRVPSIYNLTGGSQIIYAIPLESTSSPEYLCVGVTWNGLDGGRIGRVRTTEIQSGSDLPIVCGSGHTFYLVNPVYDDFNVGSLVLQTGGTLPGIVEWLDNLGASTGIEARGFAINEQGSGCVEIPHTYKEGTNITPHVHWGINDAPTGTDYVKWQLKYTITKGGGATTPPATTDAVETACTTQYAHYRSDFAAITGTNIEIGDQVNFSIKRIAAVGAAFAGEALLETIGFHHQIDTMGSRLETSK